MSMTIVALLCGIVTSQSTPQDNSHSLADPSHASIPKDATPQQLAEVRKAIQALCKVGLTDLAKYLQLPYDAHAQNLEQELEEKSRLLDKLSADIRVLRMSLGQPEYVTFAVQMYEYDAASLLKVDRGLAEQIGSIHSSLAEGPGDLFHPFSGPSAVKLKEVMSQAVRHDGARRLAEPALRTKVGIPAVFLNGGEYPVPVPKNEGPLTVEWCEFGTKFRVVPRRVKAGQIEAEWEISVSELDNSTAISLNGTRIPGLRTRRMHTSHTVVLGEPCAFAIGDQASRTLIVIVTAEGESAAATESSN